MKIKYFFPLIMGVGMVVVSCQKEVLTTEEIGGVLAVENLGGDDDESITQTKAAKYGDKACTIYDDEGNGTIAGTRCASPNGDACKTKTACAAVAVIDGSFLPDGMTGERFIEKWNTEEGKTYLISKGYYALDDDER